MNRRQFLGGAVVGTAGLGTPVAAEPVAGQLAQPAKRARMHAGHQHHSSDADLRVLAALGVNHICSALPSRTLDRGWSVGSLTQLRERVESFGLKLDMVPLPLGSSPISRAEYPNIMLGRSPQRDRDIEQICQMIRNAAKAGIPAVKYNLTLLGVVRTGTSRGRGGARYSTFVHAKARPEPPLTQAGEVSEAMMWERITYFLNRVVPVAEACRVRLCCHPHDPGMPRGQPLGGVHRVLGRVEGLRRFIEIAPSR